MAVIVVATIFPIAEHRGEVIEALEVTAEKVHASDDDALLYAMHEGPDGRIVMIEK
jgi:quinol monooxygenase YgiN